MSVEKLHVSEGDGVEISGAPTIIIALPQFEKEFHITAPNVYISTTPPIIREEFLQSHSLWGLLKAWRASKRYDFPRG